MNLRKEVVDRLLLSKSLLRRIRIHPVAEPDRHLLATHLLTAHDAAELAAAAIADATSKLPAKEKCHLMDYIASLRELHPGEAVPGTEDFRRLNQARVGIKHYGNLPDPKQWARVGETVYEYVCGWCEKYLGVSFDELDESALLTSSEVKKYLGRAKEAMAEQNYEQVLIQVGFALHMLFKENRAVWGLKVGFPKAEDAIRLTGCGVHANDFLALQQFLPLVEEEEEGSLVHNWKGEDYGHPGNWTLSNSDFCLKTSLDVALKVQDAKWIPGAVRFGVVYEHKVTAVRDGVEVCKEVWEPAPPLATLLSRKRRLECVRTLARGESLRGSFRFFNYPAPSMEGEQVREVHITPSDGSGSVVVVLRDEVTITRVPRDNSFVKEYFPGLPELDFPSD